MPIFAKQSAREKTLREVSTSAENQRLMLERKRLLNYSKQSRRYDSQARLQRPRRQGATVSPTIKNRSQHRSR